MQTHTFFNHIKISLVVTGLLVGGVLSIAQQGAPTANNAIGPITVGGGDSLITDTDSAGNEYQYQVKRGPIVFADEGTVSNPYTLELPDGSLQAEGILTAAAMITGRVVTGNPSVDYSSYDSGMEVYGTFEASGSITNTQLAHNASTPQTVCVNESGELKLCDETVPTPILGCTDPTADNYDDTATVDDNSCDFPVYKYSGGQWGVCTNDSYSRDVSCVDENGQPVAESLCTGLIEPTSNVNLAAQSCSSNSECSIAIGGTTLGGQCNGYVAASTEQVSIAGCEARSNIPASQFADAQLTCPQQSNQASCSGSELCVWTQDASQETVVVPETLGSCGCVDTGGGDGPLGFCEPKPSVAPSALADAQTICPQQDTQSDCQQYGQELCTWNDNEG